MNLNADKIYSPSEAADCIGVNRRTIHRWIERGVLDSSRIGGRRVILGQDIVAALKTGRAR